MTDPTLSGWGRLPAPGTEALGEDLARLSRDARLFRGLGRSYGDSSLPADATDRVIGTRLANRILSFNPETGVLRAEAGVCLRDLNVTFIHRGWFTPVTPGTQFVTLGGMVASDVHGKNHHVAGCFGAHVRALRVCLADGDIVTCSPSERSDLYWGCVGGMGLLGHILEVEVQMQRIPSSWIQMESERLGSLGEFLSAIQEAAAQWPMTVGWIDLAASGKSRGRGLLNKGRWAQPDEAPDHPPSLKKEKRLPIDLPNFALNPLTVRAFNMAYYWKQLKKKSVGVVSWEPFFYPLDAILDWNRGYGKRGFVQYQCVLPRASGVEGMQSLVERLAKLGGISPVTVIKDCGVQGQGVLSFPMEGMSLAVDMPVNAEIQTLTDKLNELVIGLGGRIYLSKDRFTRPEHFAAMDRRLPAFFELRKKWDPNGRLRSAQSVRLFGDSKKESEK
jgi:decaprenylphospho-beta-D-ribofuranose 2-oxidase